MDCASSFNFNFSDSGLFGLKFTGAAEHANELLNLQVNLLRNLASTKLAEDKVARGKATLRNSLLKTLDNPADRLEEAAKSVYF